MKKGIFSHPEYRNLFIAGLLVQVIAAWFSVGYHHADEHYQILEFYNYRKGLSPLTDLPWEYATYCRSALQPFIVYCYAAVLDAVGIHSPVTLAFMLRLSMAVLTWLATCRLVIVLSPTLTHKNAQRLYVLMALFLWFVPYVGARYSAETIASGCFFLAISLLLEQQREPDAGTGRLAIAGLLLGFTLFFRLQMGLAFTGLAIWILFVRKMKWTQWMLTAATACVAMALCVVVDHWFYGVWTFTPYNYFDVNIVKNVAAKFGVMPWWWYLKAFAEVGLMPISIPLMLLYLYGAFKKPMHVLTLVSITFFLGHFAIGHKELRFLFPIIPALLYVAAAGADTWLNTGVKKWQMVTFKVLAVVNTGALIFKMFTPANEVVKYYEFIYNHTKNKHAAIVGLELSPYKLDVIESNFYKPRNLQILIAQDSSKVDSVLDSIAEGKEILYLSRTLTPPNAIKPYVAERLYCEYPDWILNNNINNWQERSYIWAVYRLKHP